MSSACLNVRGRHYSHSQEHGCTSTRGAPVCSNVHTELLLESASLSLFCLGNISMSKDSCVTKPQQDKLSDMSLQHKERELTRSEKESRERRVRGGSTHLFTSMTVSGTTMCSACSKRITAKEALNCALCGVTVHSHCQDGCPDCSKTKHRAKPAILNSSLQNDTVKTKARRLPERPSSAVYASDSFRRSILGSCRGRGLSLSKSVSSNNIVGVCRVCRFLSEDSSLGLRRILSQSTDSLIFRTRAMSVESLSDDGADGQYSSALEDSDVEGQHFKADSWSLAVDRTYLQKHHRAVIKRQDVIYELIQTELHHMRTLRVLERVYRQGLQDELHLDPSTVETLFPQLEQLCHIHGRFLSHLLQRRLESLEPGSSRNFAIHRLGDILLDQFSGQPAEDMRKTYAEFCTRHLKAVKVYKETLSKDKRVQAFIQRVSRSPALRRHGYQECILLVTQRICKYPVLIQHILDSTVDEEEASSLSQALLKARELLTAIEQQMDELQKSQRVEEIHATLDPKVVARVRDGRVFRPEELLRRSLLHEGTLFWKSPGSRLKEVQVLLMTDILVFLQEKDQKYIFTSLDKPPVLSLQNLIVRPIANQERGLFCISDASPPEMYELHAASKEERTLWSQHIQQAARKCPSREEFPLIESEHKARIRRLKADLQHKDSEVLDLLHQRVALFSELSELSSGQSLHPANTRSLFRADTLQAPRAERLLLEATKEVDTLSELLLGSSGSSTSEQGPMCHGEVSLNGAHVHKEICQRLLSLSTGLHALQGAVIKQDSILELLLQPEEEWRLRRDGDSPSSGAEVGAIGELALLQRQHSLLQDELLRLRDAERRFKQSERERARLEQHMRHLISVSAGTQGAAAPRNKVCTVRWQSQELQYASDEEVVTDEEEDERPVDRFKDVQAASQV
ncbi:rho guanine nucleotide exchange factor 1a isoform X2 [Boleophthalmus pectinirostris]|uniref:rho guanine nucleotide exchange factor 1a isoform X2 n=1 Tax=Boleophthalmus pectinirostris TaxID=150288 RepID=UPI00242C556F|nr:rho guanine nucleotide exchange factor 1a isoform X2 [Boleophthalmus pectinirostris]